jgi:di/tricarboxylate transporter
MGVAADFHMWFTLAVVLATIVLYAVDGIPLEAVSVTALVALLLGFTLVPFSVGGVPFSVDKFLLGFANPGLATILGLLIVGQALFQTEALERPTQAILRLARGRHDTAIVATLIGIACLSAFLNNTPVVVMFLPIISAFASASGSSPARVLMSLSFITILGGMTTVIGSSTNLLVVDAAERLTGTRMGFFDFTPIALMLATVGAAYVLFVMPRLLRPRRTMVEAMQDGTGKQFLAEILVTDHHPLVGKRAVSGLFPGLKDMTVRLVQRGERPILPPFEDLEIHPGDLVIVAATRGALTRALTGRDALVATETPGDGENAASAAIPPGAARLAEGIVAPGSRLIGRTVSKAAFRTETGCIVIGIERRSRMPRMVMSEIRLEEGDVLLFAGRDQDLDRLRGSRDVLLIDRSLADLPPRHTAPRALAVFAAVVVAAATGAVPIMVAALVGAFAVIALGCINVRQALRVCDSRIIFLIGSSIALATALEATGGATAIANAVVDLLDGQSELVVLSAFFLMMAVLTNILSNNAMAVLFTPIAIGIAERLSVPPEPFIVATILGANCSFATPIGYQTNLLVMGPGHYTFADFLRAGAPLVLLMWVTFTLVAPWYYGL